MKLENFKRLGERERSSAEGVGLMGKGGTRLFLSGGSHLSKSALTAEITSTNSPGFFTASLLPPQLKLYIL